MSQSGQLSHGVLYKGDNTPWLLGELLGQTEGLEKPRLYSGGLCLCWPAGNQGGESLELVVPPHCTSRPFMAESEEELKSLLRKVKEESEKVGLKLNIQKMKIMASGPITSRQTDGDSVELVKGETQG